MVGAAYNALDEYETMMTTKTTPLPPFIPRKLDADYQRYFGGALAKIATAEAALMNAADQHMELCQRFVDDGTPYCYADDHRLGCIGREVMIQAWEIVQGDLCRTAGSSSAAAGPAARPDLPRHVDRQQPPQHAAPRLGLPRGRARRARPTARVRVRQTCRAAR